MVKLTEDFIFRLKTVCSITDIVGSYLQLKVSGKNMKCCCPFHSEKTPSFTVFETTQSFYCFGCGFGGDVITFVEKIENVGYVEAVRILAKKTGLAFPEANLNDEEWNTKKNILDINKEAARFFFRNLTTSQGRSCLFYLLKDRKVKRKTIVSFGLGYALNSWDGLKKHLLGLGFKKDVLIKSGLFVKSKNGSYYDRFRDRLIFPIIDLKGDVIGFGGRKISEAVGPKYLNSCDSLVFKKSFGLFALNFAKNSCDEYFLLCEGYMDVVMLHQNGFGSAVASLGSSLTKEQSRLLKRYKREVILAYDMDVAGSLGASRAIKVFEEVGMRPRILQFKGAKDPDEYIKRYGPGFFKNSVKNATTIEKMRLKNLEQKYNLNDIDQRNKYIKEYCSFLVELKDPVKKEIYLADLCAKFSIDKYVILNHINFINRTKKNSFRKGFYEKRKNIYDLKSSKKDIVKTKLLKAQEGILRFLYYNPDKVELVRFNLKSDYFNVKEYAKIYKMFLSNIDDKKELDITNFGQNLDEKEMSLFSKIVNDCAIYKNSEEELFDYIKVLKSSCEYENKDVSSMSLLELENIRRGKATGRF